MATVKAMSNTTQNLPCVLCGASGNIVREAPNPADCRVKCNSPHCGHTFSKQDSLDAQAANAIPENNFDFRDIEESQPPPAPQKEVVPSPPPEHSPSKKSGAMGTLDVPRTPAFVFISKDRSHVEFCTKKDIKKVALQWETTGKSYNLYELHSKQVTAKIEFE